MKFFRGFTVFEYSMVKKENPEMPEIDRKFRNKKVRSVNGLTSLEKC